MSDTKADTTPKEELTDYAFPELQIAVKAKNLQEAEKMALKLSTQPKENK